MPLKLLNPVKLSLCTVFILVFEVFIYKRLLQWLKTIETPFFWTDPNLYSSEDTSVSTKCLLSITKSNRTREATLWFVLINPNKSAGSIVLRSIGLVHRQVARASEWGLLKRFVFQPLPWFGLRWNLRIESFSLKSFWIDWSSIIHKLSEEYWV